MLIQLVISELVSEGVDPSYHPNRKCMYRRRNEKVKVENCRGEEEAKTKQNNPKAICEYINIFTCLVYRVNWHKT